MKTSIESSGRRKAVAILLFNQGKILGVTRKTDLNDFGLPGGKLDGDEDFITAAKREVKEETGLDIFALFPVFHRLDGEFFVITYIAQWKGEIQTTEKGRVDWITWEELKAGSFGEYNSSLQAALVAQRLIEA